MGESPLGCVSTVAWNKRITILLKINLMVEWLKRRKGIMERKWERRERKERKRKAFVKDNRSSVNILARLVLAGAKKLKKKKKRI